MVDSIEIKGVGELQKKVDKIGEGLKDMRPLFELFSSDFYKSEKELFFNQGIVRDSSKSNALLGARKIRDLSEGYKPVKMKKYGFIYPILVGAGRLSGSLLSRSHREAINIIKKQAFAIGTTVTHAIFHHSDKPRKKLPRRPVFDDRDDSPMIVRWTRIADVFIEKVANKAFD